MTTKGDAATVNIAHGPPAGARTLDDIVRETEQALRAIARQQLSSANAHRHKGATSLVHDATLKLLRRDELRPVSREHFIALMRNVMHEELVDFIRHRSTAKAGGGHRQVAVLDFESGTQGPREMTAEELREALDELRRVDATAEHVFVLVRGFDCSVREAGKIDQIDYREALRCWKFACVWLATWLDRRRRTT